MNKYSKGRFTEEWKNYRAKIVDEFRKEYNLPYRYEPYFREKPELYNILASKIHNNKYDYSKTIYKDKKEKVTIICPIHGEFKVGPSWHLLGNGCVKCNQNYDEFTATNNESFIRISKQIHGKDTYDYSLLDFKSMNQKIKLICNKCGRIFELKAAHHIRKRNGCPVCNRIAAGEKSRLDPQEFIERCKVIHGDKYDYSETKYVNSKTKIKVRCNACHEYFYIYPSNHLDGVGHSTCKYNPKGSTGERILEETLKENNIKFEKQKIFEDCKLGNYLPFDFYLPDYNICIEYQGRQHYEPVDLWGGEETLKKQQFRDETKRQYCEKKGIELIEIKYSNYSGMYEYNIKKDIEPYIQYIKNKPLN